MLTEQTIQNMSEGDFVRIPPNMNEREFDSFWNDNAPNGLGYEIDYFKGFRIARAVAEEQSGDLYVWLSLAVVMTMAVIGSLIFGDVFTFEDLTPAGEGAFALAFIVCASAAAMFFIACLLCKHLVRSIK